MQYGRVVQTGSGGLATGGVAAGAGGAAIGRDVHGDVNVTNITYQGAEVSIPSPQAITKHRAALRRRLADDACRRWGGMSVYIQEEGATLPIEASPYQTGWPGHRHDLLQSLRVANRLLVLGEPGSGKTVALERLAWELCVAEEPAVPVLVRLFHYDGKPLADWVRSLLHETGYLRVPDDRALAACLHNSEARFFFLFDGLNEVSSECRTALRGELVRWMAACHPHPVILTSRMQDELWRLLRDELDQVVVLQPIADEQARAYLVAHLDERGDSLYARLDERLRAMARTPLLLWMIKEAGKEAGASLPGNRGQLYERFVSRMLQRDTDRGLDADIRQAVKRQALVDLADQLGQERRLKCTRDEAIQVVARRLGEAQAAQAEEIVRACARHGLLAGEDTVWFAPHQTVQEHFAALALQVRAEQEWTTGARERLRRVGQRLLARKPQGVVALGAHDWWMETFVQLAGMVDDANRLAREVSEVNPWLAWWCVEEGRAVSAETRSLVEARSVRLLRSERPADRRRAVQTLARIQSERAVDPLLQAAADADQEIAGLACEALLRMGAEVRDRALSLAQQPEASLHRAGLAYLSALVGQPLVWVPPGPFLMGSNTDTDPRAFEDEQPQHTVTLPGYWIGRYPVTVARYKEFVHETGYRPAGQTPLTGLDDRPVADVTWHDALAYCRWLSENTGLAAALPSEAEWEKAARGTDGGLYPWGSELPDPDRCNYGNNVRSTTPVGGYSPRADSPYGCADMAGNVWEWTRSVYAGYPYNPADGREDLDSEGSRVLRGGAFYSSEWLVRCASRYRGDPGPRYGDVGFRCVVAPG